MTGNIGFSTTVVLVTIIDRGSQSRSFSSRMSPGGSAALPSPLATPSRIEAISRMRRFIGTPPSSSVDPKESNVMSMS